MPTSIPGICGPFYDGCHLSWASTESNNVGSYPSEWLPSQLTVWHGVFTARFPPVAPILPPGSFGSIGGGLLDVYIPTIPAPITFQSYMVINFCQTAYQLNFAYTLTQEDINNAFSAVELDSQGKPIIINGEKISKDIGALKIKLNTYIFDAISITDVPFNFEQKLTPEEKAALIEQQEFESDRIFRKLVNEVDTSVNRLVGIQPNTEGIEYRLDNGTEISNEFLDGPGLGNLTSVDYRDGTSDTLIVDLSKYIKSIITVPDQPDKTYERGINQSNTQKNGGWVAGDIIYISFIEVKKHYMRQYVNISWILYDGGTSFQGAYAIPQSIRGANYRFFTWEVINGNTTKSLHGWRAVESFGIKANAMVMFGSPNPSVDFPENVNLTSFSDDTESTWTETQYKTSDWYNRKQYNSYDDSGEKYEHLFYNVHSKSLAIKDTLKFGIERNLAQELMIDIRNGRNTFFPILVLTGEDETKGTFSGESLNATNSFFYPIQPVIKMNISNCYSTTQSVGSFNVFGIPYGWNNGAGDLITYHSYDSPIIREKFDKDTRILVERFFAYGASQDIRLVSIRAVPKSSGHAISCISDPSGIYSLISHYDQDQNIVFNIFNNKRIVDDFSRLDYRPDKKEDISNIKTVNPNLFANEIGYNGLLGDFPGFSPGQKVNLGKQLSNSAFIYSTLDASKVPSNFFSDSDAQIKPLPSKPSINKNSSDNFVLTISLNQGYYGKTRFDYKVNEVPDSLKLNRNVSATLKIGGTAGSIVAVIDNIYISSTSSVASEEIIHEWFYIDTIEIAGDLVQYLSLINVIAVGMPINQALDFLTNRSSDTSNDGNPSQKSVSHGIFINNPVSSIAEDIKSNLYVFFEDNDHNISCMYSHDFGYSWFFYYGIIEKMGDAELSNPFVLSDFTNNLCYIFYQVSNKIMVKIINFGMFNAADSMTVERTIPDILVKKGTKTVIIDFPTLPVTYDLYDKVKQTIYTTNGLSAIRQSLSYIAAGDLTDLQFISDILFKKAIIRDTDTKKENITTLFPVSLSSNTCIPKSDVTNIFFSAYLNKSRNKTSGNGGLVKLFFLSTVIDETNTKIGQGGGGLQLQCHFSSDGGQSWSDFWEFLNYGYNRQRITHYTENEASEISGYHFIDRSQDGTTASFKYVNGTIGSEPNQFGINIHWSRLKKHKIATGTSPVNSESESLVLTVSSPYVFYQESFQKVFLFYVYQNCLLCKVFSDTLFHLTKTQYGFKTVKTELEKNTKAWFVDGDLSSNDIREELNGYINIETKEIMSDGNIYFTYSDSIDTFNSDRFVLPQRVCAYELQNGYVRIMYKIGISDRLTAAIWLGDSLGWRVEEMFTKKIKGDSFDANSNPNIKKLLDQSFTNVCGGFGDNSFECPTVIGVN